MATPIEQLEAMKSLPENWDGYGASKLDFEAIEIAKQYVGRIEQVKSRFDLKDVFVNPGRDGGIQIEWSDSTHDHELEINADHSIGLLHVDRVTGEMEEEWYEPTLEPYSFASELVL